MRLHRRRGLPICCENPSPHHNQIPLNPPLPKGDRSSVAIYFATVLSSQQNAAHDEIKVQANGGR